MPGPYPDGEPHAGGLLDVGDGQRISWEDGGNPQGLPALVFHGGPGSGCGPWFRRLFDPRAYRVLLHDQRGCGSSLPHAGAADVDLSHNTTAHLVEDAERLRRHLGIERWLVLGGSWGSTLALSYAEAHPERVCALVLFAVTTGRHSELDWTFRGGLARFFPAEWARLRAGAPAARTDSQVPAAYSRLLHDRDPDVRRRAAEAWCLWESATPSWPPREGLAPRFRDPAYALAFARLVTHYVRHELFLEDGALVRGAGTLASIPGVLVQARLDLQAPLGNAWALHEAWPRAELVVVDEIGHGLARGVERELVRATERLAVELGGRSAAQERSAQPAANEAHVRHRRRAHDP